jgi:hypothetical protein
MINKRFILLLLVIGLWIPTGCNNGSFQWTATQIPTLQSETIITSPTATELPAITPSPTANPTVVSTAAKPTANITPTAMLTAPALVIVLSTPDSEKPVIEMPRSTVVPAGLAALNHPEASKYIFLVDPTQWQIDQVGQWDFLAHKKLPGCRLDIVPPLGPPAPERLYTIPIGSRNWVIFEYQQTTMIQYKDLYLYADNSKDPDCNQAQAAVLGKLLTGAEYEGQPVRSEPTVTQHPGKKFSDCPEALPSYLLPGDRVYIIADTLRLRSEPQVDDSQIIKTFPQYAPYFMTVLEGVSCVDKLVFRHVELSLMAEGGESYTGWMAESDGQEYFLKLWDPGW